MKELTVEVVCVIVVIAVDKNNHCERISLLLKSISQSSTRDFSETHRGDNYSKKVRERERKEREGGEREKREREK